MPAIAGRERFASGRKTGAPVARAKLPLAGVRAPSLPNGVGPLYDGDAPGELSARASTGNRGLVAYFDLSPGNLDLTLTPSATGPLGPDRFTLPIRPNAVTVLALALPPR